MNLQSPETLKKFFSSVSSFSNKSVEEFATHLLKHFEFIQESGLAHEQAVIPASLIPEVAGMMAQEHFKEIIETSSLKNDELSSAGPIYSSYTSKEDNEEMLKIEQELLVSLDKALPKKKTVRKPSVKKTFNKKK